MRISCKTLTKLQTKRVQPFPLIYWKPWRLCWVIVFAFHTFMLRQIFCNKPNFRTNDLFFCKTFPLKKNIKLLPKKGLCFNTKLLQIKSANKWSKSIIKFAKWFSFCVESFFCIFFYFLQKLKIGLRETDGKLHSKMYCSHFYLMRIG